MFFFKQKTAYEMRISDWSSDVCSSDLLSARWTPEASQDAMAQQGIDLETEITAALAQEITAEIDQTILANLRALPGAPAVTYEIGRASCRERVFQYV